MAGTGHWKNITPETKAFAESLNKAIKSGEYSIKGYGVKVEVPPVGTNNLGSNGNLVSLKLKVEFNNEWGIPKGE